MSLRVSAAVTRIGVDVEESSPHVEKNCEKSFSRMQARLERGEMFDQPVASEQIDRLDLGARRTKDLHVAALAAGGNQRQGDGGGEDARHAPQTQTTIQQQRARFGTWSRRRLRRRYSSSFNGHARREHQVVLSQFAQQQSIKLSSIRDVADATQRQIIVVQYRLRQ